MLYFKNGFLTLADPGGVSCEFPATAPTGGDAEAWGTGLAADSSAEPAEAMGSVRIELTTTVARP